MEDKLRELVWLVERWKLKGSQEYEASLRATMEGSRGRLIGKASAYKSCAKELEQLLQPVPMVQESKEDV